MTLESRLTEFADAVNASIQAVAFLPVPDEQDESDPVYFYFGWADVNGAGLIQRQLRASSATMSTTPPLADFTASWAARATLGYV